MKNKLQTLLLLFTVMLLTNPARAEYVLTPDTKPSIVIQWGMSVLEFLRHLFCFSS